MYYLLFLSEGFSDYFLNSGVLNLIVLSFLVTFPILGAQQDLYTWGMVVV